MQINSHSDTLPPVGMSDETESVLWAQQHGAGLGEVFAELHGADELDLNGLGFNG